MRRCRVLIFRLVISAVGEVVVMHIVCSARRAGDWRLEVVAFGMR